MQTVIVVFHVFITLSLIGLVLIQHGKGADAGAAFGSGASSTVFGARGSGSFLTRATAVLAALFFITSMTLGYFATQTGKQPGLMAGVEQPAVSELGGGVLPEPEVVSEVPPAPESEFPVPPDAAGGEVVVPQASQSGGEVPVPVEAAESEASRPTPGQQR